MARSKGYDYTQAVRIPVSLETQPLPGTLEDAIQGLVERCMGTTIFGSRSKEDETGGPAYDPQIRLEVILLAYARGIISSRKREQACREHIAFMALACGQVPDQRTSAAFVASLKAALASLFRDVLWVCAEQDL
jgi:transposase